MASSQLVLLRGHSAVQKGQPPALVPRAPLGPFPEPQTYDHVLPFTPPAGRDLYFYRGNFCGLRIPNAPFVPGAHPDHPELVMAALLDNYPESVQEAFLLKYAENGYTHLQRSIGHSLYYGGTLAEHIALSRKAQGYGLFTDEWLLGAEAFATRDKDAAFWQPILDPILEQLLGAGVIDTACVAWQMDQLQNGAPGNPTISIIAYVADRLPSWIPLYTHWMNDAMAWWLTNIDPHTGRNLGSVWSDQYQTIRVHDRFSWWIAMQPYLTGPYHQGDVHTARTDPYLYQSKMRDTLNPFSDGRMGQSRRGAEERPFAFVEMECTAQAQFDGGCSEDEGDMIGYILSCTKSDGGTGGHVAGYGNGARMPDGTRL